MITFSVKLTARQIKALLEAASFYDGMMHPACVGHLRRAAHVLMKVTR